MRKITKIFTTLFLVTYSIVLAFDVYFIIKFIIEVKPMAVMILSLGVGISIGSLFTYILFKKDNR